jgi:hypothetical protein
LEEELVYPELRDIITMKPVDFKLINKIMDLRDLHDELV